MLFDFMPFPSQVIWLLSFALILFVVLHIAHFIQKFYYLTIVPALHTKS
jgi:hypothetical protein